MGVCAVNTKSTAARAATRVTLISSPTHENRCRERAERDALTPALVEIRRVEPAPERGVERRPFLVDHRVPRGVAIPALVDARLPEDPLIREPQPQGRGAGWGIERVALPLVAAVAEIEGTLHHQVHRLGRGDGALKQRRVVDVTDLDGTGTGIDAEVAGDADRLAGGEIYHGVELRIGGGGDGSHPSDVRVER